MQRPYFTGDRELVMRMLQREQQLRTCEHTQKLYDGENWNVPNIPPYHIEDNIQRQVVLLETKSLSPLGFEKVICHFIKR